MLRKTNIILGWSKKTSQRVRNDESFQINNLSQKCNFMYKMMKKFENLKIPKCTSKVLSNLLIMYKVEF